MLYTVRELMKPTELYTQHKCNIQSYLNFQLTRLFNVYFFKMGFNWKPLVSIVSIILAQKLFCLVENGCCFEWVECFCFWKFKIKFNTFMETLLKFNNSNAVYEFCFRFNPPLEYVITGIFRLFTLKQHFETAN